MSDLALVLRYPHECTEGVTRRDEFQPCDKPAVAVRIDPARARALGEHLIAWADRREPRP